MKKNYRVFLLEDAKDPSSIIQNLLLDFFFERNKTNFLFLIFCSKYMDVFVFLKVCNKKTDKSIKTRTKDRVVYSLVRIFS